jgi:S-adenosylmethionine uptake transporter
VELVFYRSVIGCLFCLCIVGTRYKILVTSNLRVHFWRSITGFFSLLLFFYALPRLNLPTVMAMLQTAPLFLAVLTAVFLRERISLPLFVTLLVSFIGMLVVLRPGVGTSELLAGGASIGAGLMAGCAYFNVRRLGVLNEGGVRTVFYFTAFSTVLSVLLIVGYGSFSPLTGSGIFWLLLIGVSATGGQLAVTRGLQRGHTPVASALLYSSIIFAGMFDYLIWDAVPDAFSWLGIALISGSGIAALYLNIKRQQA